MINKIIIPLLVFLISCTPEIKKNETHLIVPDGFTIESVVDASLLSYPMFAHFNHKGDLFLFESTLANTMDTEAMAADPVYHIRRLRDSDQDGTFDESTIFADKIPFPMGGSFHNGSLYVAATPDLLKFTDTDDNGIADEREVVLTGWTLSSNGAILSGPFKGPDGYLYLADARRSFDIQTKEGENLKGGGARIWRCLPDGSKLESMSGGGFDNAIEIIFMPSGETIGTMTYFTEPQNGERDALMHWVEGGVYPKPQITIEEDQLKLTGPLMPVMTKMPRVAPAGLLRFIGNTWGDEFDGNLFSAEFNTGRIMRHIVSPSGATYKTDDSPFLEADTTDIHPTDVLQDADGSMLVVVTGGWFIRGCPLSQVEKPDIKGGIYRVRKTGSRTPKDPWGHAINFQDLTTEQLSNLLSDARPKVSTRAKDELISRGSPSIESLGKVATDGMEANVRATAVFALSQITDANATPMLIKSLDDPDDVVKVAAIRSLGLQKIKAAGPKLNELVVNGSAPVRRQSATALEQIGNPDAVDALLEAAKNPQDRFVEHAIIHALIELGNTTPMLNALSNSSEKMRYAAAIALDQMDNSPLKKEHLVPFLSSEDPLDRSLSIWIMTHRPEWSDIVVAFIKKSEKQLDAHNAESLQELIKTFSSSADLQKHMAAKVMSPSSGETIRAFYLDAMMNADLKDFPDQWSSSLQNLLDRNLGNDVNKSVMDIIEARSLEGFGSSLSRIYSDKNSEAEIRLKALAAKIATVPEVNEKEFGIILEYLAPERESFLRQNASRLLIQSALSDQQLLAIAKKVIPAAPMNLLPNLIDIYQGNSNPEVGTELISGLSADLDRLDNVSEEGLQNNLAFYPEYIMELAKPLFETIRKKHADRLIALEALESNIDNGDVGRGRAIFFGKGTCFTCHAVGEEGGTFGPDLTNIGEIRSKHDMLEAIVYPSVSFAREYETYQIITKDQTYTGIIAEKTPTSLIISTPNGAGIRVDASEVISIKPHDISMMPPGLEKQLSTKELSDLMAFLQALPYRLDRMIELAQ